MKFLCRNLHRRPNTFLSTHSVEKVRAEWAMVCIAHNVLKLAAGMQPVVA